MGFLSPDSPITRSLLSSILFPAPPRSLTGNPLNSSFFSGVDFQLLVMVHVIHLKAFFPCSVCLRRAIWESRAHPKQAFHYLVDQRQVNLLMKASSSSLGGTLKVSFRCHVWKLSLKPVFRIWFLLEGTLCIFLWITVSGCLKNQQTKPNLTGVYCLNTDLRLCLHSIQYSGSKRFFLPQNLLRLVIVFSFKF